MQAARAGYLQAGLMCCAPDMCLLLFLFLFQLLRRRAQGFLFQAFLFQATR